MAKTRPSRHIRQKKKNGSNFLKVIFYLAEILFFGGIIYVLFFAQLLAVTDIKVSGNNFIETSSILGEINPGLNGKYLNIIPKNNLLLVNSSGLEEEISSQFRLIRKIEIKKKFPASLTAEIQERKPSLILCEKECYLLGENGEAYDAAENISEEEKERYNILSLRDENKKDVSVGQFILDPSLLVYLEKVRRKIPEGVEGEIEKEFWTPAIISNDIRLKTKESWGIYLSRNIELEKEVEVLRAVLKEKITEEERKDLEYIDLRIDNKVYYKFKEGTPSEEARVKAEEALRETQAPAEPAEEKKEDKKKD